MTRALDAVHDLNLWDHHLSAAEAAHLEPHWYPFADDPARPRSAVEIDSEDHDEERDEDPRERWYDEREDEIRERQRGL